MPVRTGGASLAVSRLRRHLRGLTGFHVHYAFVAAPIVVGVASAAVVVVLGSVVPAWRAARTNVIEAIGYE